MDFARFPDASSSSTLFAKFPEHENSDWNPATDLQAKARVHRSGQTREVFIYRYLLGGYAVTLVASLDKCLVPDRPALFPCEQIAVNRYDRGEDIPKADKEERDLR